MIEGLICGIYNSTVVPLTVDNDARVAFVNAESFNTSENASTELEGVLMGLYNNELIPVLVDNEGRLQI